MQENPLHGAVATLLAEAEALTGQIAGQRAALETAELKRRKLVAALDSAVQALPQDDRAEFAHRMRALATELTPKRGRVPDSRLEAVIEYLAERAHFGPGEGGDEVVKVSEVQTQLVRLGWKRLPRGYASGALARLAEQGMVIKNRFARYRINRIHPEIVSLRFKLIDAAVAQIDERDRALKEAERRGREGRAYRPL